MRTAQRTDIDARAERRAMMAVVAVFALLFQALVPSLAAASADLGATPICRPLAAGSAQGGAGDPQAPGHGHHCQHCVCPATAGEPPPVQSHARVTYATALPPAPLHPFVEPPPARAPPRPPGQGPPPPNA